MKKLSLLVIFPFVFCEFLQKDNLIFPKINQNSVIVADTISLIFAGDIMGHSPQYKAAYDAETQTYNYDVCFQHVKPYIEDADFAIANLEVPLAGAPYSGFPNFSSPDALLDALKNAGYDVMLTANNHAADRGAAGIRRTIKTIESRNLRLAGSYYDKLHRDSIYPLILEKSGLKIALLNYTYGTNGNVVSKPNIVNMIDTSLIINDISRAKQQKADITVVCVHWGEEYFTKSNREQQKLARLLVRNGVDLIIGGHPHVVQEAELIENQDSIATPVFYSLGNSISNQRKINTDGGIMVKVKIDSGTKQIFSVEYLPVYVHKGVLREKYQYHLIPTIDFVRNPSDFSIPTADSLSLTVFDKNTRNRLQNIQIIQ